MIPYLDLHCDTLELGYLQKKEDIYDLPEGMLDIRRMQKADMFGQFFAIFFPPASRKWMPEEEEYYQALKKLFYNSLNKHGDCISFAGSAEEAEQNRRMGKLSAFLTIEDGRHVQGNMENIRRFYRDGVRLITLTWNSENCFGAPNSRDPGVMQKGLTEFGKQAIEYMNEIGMIVDVSHLSDGGFYDVLECSKKPFIASHSNARALSPHPRNLTDDMIRKMAQKGGAAGINFYGAFLNEDITRETSTLEALVSHILYMSNVGGEDFVALGTDFDGISGEVEIHNPQLMQKLFSCLEKKGFSQTKIEKLAYRNVLRVLHDTLDVGCGLER